MKNKIEKVLFVVIAAFMMISSNVAAQGVTFTEIKSEADWKQVLAKSKKDKKPVFLDIYATWCGPCKKLDREVFADAQVGGFHNKSFVNAKIDGESDFGKVLAGEMKLKGYPSLYYLDHDKYLFGQIVGFRDVTEILEFGGKVEANKAKMRQLDNQFRQKKINATQVKEYIDILTELESAEMLMQVAEGYLNGLSAADLVKPENKAMLQASGVTLESPVMKKILDNAEAMYQSWGEDDYMKFFSGIFENSLVRSIETTNPELMNQIIEKILPVYFVNNPASLPYGIFVTKKYYALGTNDVEGYIAAVKDYYIGQGEEGQDFLVQELAENLQNPDLPFEVLEASTSWVSWIPESERRFDALYLGAVAYVFVGDIVQAQQMIDQARKLAVGEEVETLNKLVEYLEESEE